MKHVVFYAISAIQGQDIKECKTGVLTTFPWVS